jgi:hypothetical protein
MQRVVSVTANTLGVALGQVADQVRAGDSESRYAPQRRHGLGQRAVFPSFEETVSGLRLGLLLHRRLFLCWWPTFSRSGWPWLLCPPSLPLSARVVLMLLLSGTRSSAVLYGCHHVDRGSPWPTPFYGDIRRDEPAGGPFGGGLLPWQGRRGAWRAILMTGRSMIAGMAPIAFGFSEGLRTDGTAGKGGHWRSAGCDKRQPCLFYTAVYALLQRRAGSQSASLHPHDPESRYTCRPKTRPRSRRRDAKVYSYSRRARRRRASASSRSRRDWPVPGASGRCSRHTASHRPGASWRITMSSWRRQAG